MSLPLVHHSGNFDTQAVIVIVCSTLGLYNALELLLLIFITFKQYKGLYFWSLLIASFGVIPYVIGWLIVYFSLTHNYVGFIIDSYGWITMVTGQSVVLYSRLHLVLKNENILRVVKWMIIFDAVVFHTMTTVVLFGSSIGDEQGPFNQSWKVIEKLQMTAFCVQEFIISGLYVWKTVQLLQIVNKKGTIRVMWQLFSINIIIIAMDIALLALEYRNLRTLEQAFKVVIYSIKLKLEFAILGKLVELVQQNERSLSDAMLEVDTYVDETKTKASSDLTMVASTCMSTISSRPQWLDDLEKKAVPHTGAVQHVETVEDGYGNQVHRARMISVELDPHTMRGQEDSIQRVRRSRASEVDFMYAEAMRSLSE
jgi:hypothetical protein